MTQKLILAGIFITSFHINITFGQTAREKINPSAFNSQLLSDLIMNQINAARDSMGLQTLEEEGILVQAAEHQAQYLKKVEKLTHKQKNRRYSTPSKRVKRFGGKFKTVAENIAYISAGPTLIQGNNRQFTYNTYENVAKELVNGWMNSAGHFKNISAPDMDRTGVAVAYDPESNLLYAVQVFTESYGKGEKPAAKILWFRL